ncbi:MAG: glutathione binding-like protein [Rhodanobacter sp.]
MDLYFSPLACSLATRIALYEAGGDARFIQVDTKAKRVVDGTDYLTITPMGQVPLLRTDDGDLLSENTAVLQYIADHYPDARLAPTAGFERSRMQQWLGFIGTELHKAVFVPQLDAKATAEVKAYARDKTKLRLDLLQQHLAEHIFLLDRFSIADIYLFVVLNWSAVIGLDLKQWPAVHAFQQRLLQRENVSKALHEEVDLYKAEQAHLVNAKAG